MASSLPWTTKATLSTMASKASEKDWTVRAATRGVDDMECLHRYLLAPLVIPSPRMDTALAVDIGGTKLAAGLVTDERGGAGVGDGAVEGRLGRGAVRRARRAWWTASPAPWCAGSGAAGR